MRSRRSASLFLARLQLAGAGSDLESRDRKAHSVRAPLCAYVLVDYSGSSQSVSVLGSDANYNRVLILSTKAGRLGRTHHVALPPDQRQPALAQTLGYYAQCSARGVSILGDIS